MNNDVKLKVGEYEVYDSGTIITHDNKEIVFEIKNLKVKILFKTDSEKKAHDANITLVEGGSCLQIALTNFDNSLGTGLTEPIEIGIINGSRLCLQFLVHALNDGGTKMFSYTWLTKK